MNRARQNTITWKQTTRTRNRFQHSWPTCCGGVHKHFEIASGSGVSQRPESVRQIGQALSSHAARGRGRAV